MEEPVFTAKVRYLKNYISQESAIISTPMSRNLLVRMSWSRASNAADISNNKSWIGYSVLSELSILLMTLNRL